MSRYTILSPDGFPISPEPFTSLKKAQAYFKEWIQRYAQQGYYSQTCYNGYKRQIPLEDIEFYCDLIKS